MEMFFSLNLDYNKQSLKVTISAFYVYPKSIYPSKSHQLILDP